MEFETVIGLEVHVELKTNTKIFSSSPNQFGSTPNTNTSVIDLGYPGVLPVLNKKVVEYATKAAVALNCEIAKVTTFDRKNYFYPDNPKAYQISQLDHPIGENGWIEIEVDGYTKKIGITRIHMEEDAGKLTHGNGYSLVDYNRQGTPLIEIVSEPDIRTPAEAYAYLEKLKAIILYTGVSDCKMEEGSLRCDANVSIRPVGQKEFGTKTELKNLNSFNFVKKGLEYEVERQKELVLSGETIRQETRRYDEATGKTILMRVKEGAEDYRYFPEPDLLPITIDEEWLEEIKSSIPELPDARQKKYVENYQLPKYDASVLTLTREMADFFEATVESGADPKLASNWLMGEISAYLKANSKELSELLLTPTHLATIIQLIEKGKLSTTMAKTVLLEVIKSGEEPEKIVKEKGLVLISDEATLIKIIDEILDNNEKIIEDYKNGKQKALGFFVGQIMKATKGQANPPLVNKLLVEQLDKR